MDDQQYGRTIDRLSPSRRGVFDALLALGRATDAELVEAMNGSRSTVIPRRSDLAKAGLVRAAGSKPTASGGKTTIWEIVPAAEVEQWREIAEQRGPRRQEIAKWHVDDRIRVARALIRDPAVNEALQATSGPGSRRTRARALQEAERARRERADQIRREEADKGELVAFLKARSHLQRSVEAVREVGFFLDEELERADDDRPALIPDWAWPQVLDLLDEGSRLSDATHERIARHVGHEPRSGVQIIESSTAESAAARPIKVLNASAAEFAAATDGERQPRT